MDWRRTAAGDALVERERGDGAGEDFERTGAAPEGRRELPVAGPEPKWPRFAGAAASGAVTTAMRGSPVNFLAAADLCRRARILAYTITPPAQQMRSAPMPIVVPNNSRDDCLSGVTTTTAERGAGPTATAAATKDTLRLSASWLVPESSSAAEEIGTDASAADVEANQASTSVVVCRRASFSASLSACPRRPGAAMAGSYEFSSAETFASALRSAAGLPPAPSVRSRLIMTVGSRTSIETPRFTSRVLLPNGACATMAPCNERRLLNFAPSRRAVGESMTRSPAGDTRRLIGASLATGKTVPLGATTEMTNVSLEPNRMAELKEPRNVDAILEAGLRMRSTGSMPVVLHGCDRL